MLSGILNIDKPQGWTSHDVVGRVRALLHQKQVGHAGTLDPLATGVLLVAVGHGTKLTSYLMRSTKVYRAEVVLGASTATDDAEAPLQDYVAVDHIRRPALDEACYSMVGNILQIPPAYSAIKRDGQRLYRLARSGVEVALPARPVTVYSIDIESWESPRLILVIRCSAGTYVRSLARDIGNKLGVPAYLHALRRVGSGRFNLSESVALAQLDQRMIRRNLRPIDVAVLDLSAVVLSPEQERRVRQGGALPANRTEVEAVRLYGADGALVALGGIRGQVLRPFRVFN